MEKAAISGQSSPSSVPAPSPDFRALFESAPDLYLVLAPDLKIVAASDAYLLATMTEREAILGRAVFDVFPDNPADAEATGVHNLGASLARVLQNRAPDSMEVQKYDVRRPAAEGGGFEQRFWKPVNRPVFGPGGEVAYILHRAEDVTERMTMVRAQREREDELTREARERSVKLRQNEELFRALVEGAKDHAIFMLDPEGRIASWNSGAERIKGYRAEEIIGKHFSRFYRDEDVLLGKPERELEIAAADGRYEEEGLRLRKDGTAFWANVVITALRDDAGRLQGFSKITRDITERKQAEEKARRLMQEEEARKAAELHAEEIRKEREQLRVTLQSIGDGVITTDAAGRVGILNHIAQFLTGWTEETAAGLPLDEVFRIVNEENHQAVESPAARVLREGAIVGLANHTLLISRDGTERPIADSAAPIRDGTGDVVGVVLVFRDFSERRRIERALHQSQKMEAVGQLAGGVAHDFNNLLTVILGACEFLDTDAALSADSRDLAREIHSAADRAAALTRQLLAFSRRQILQPELVDLNATVKEIAKMIERLIGEDIILTTSLAPQLWSVKVDRGQIEQVVVNLAVNARDAMPQGGKLTIETANVVLDAEYVQPFPDLATGQYVLLSVSDTGCGMDAKTKARMFEPFFTTKEVGKGTGLGLATVFGIVKQSGGHVAVYSEPGLGATFKVYLPQSGEGAAKQPQPKQQSPSLGTETVLVVEDDLSVRAFTCRILRTHGYDVLEARDGNEALLIHQRHSGEIHLVLTDMVMPSMGGRALAENLIARQPGLRMLFMSGYSAEAVVRHGILESQMDFIQKPFLPAALAAKVREVLDRPARPTAKE